MLDWQLIIVFLIVAASAAYVARALWRSIFTPGRGGCASCNSCQGEDSAEQPKPLVTLDEGFGESRNVLH